jgi:hypothetical protein
VSLAVAGEATAKSFSLPQASVAIAVEPDGSLSLEEHITFAFDGSFSGAYRDIPLRQGEVIQDVFVSEEGARYSPGASAELGSSGLPGTFGTARIDGGLRIVWHYGAFSEVRTLRSATGSSESQSPTTTSSTSTSRSGETSGSSPWGS